MLLDGQIPGFIRGIDSGANCYLMVSNANVGGVTYHPVTHQMTEHAKGLNELHGVVAGSGGSIVVAESGAGRVLVISGNEMKTAATGLSRPAGIAVAPDGSCYVSESGKGTVAHVNGGFSTAVGGLDEPQGLTLIG